MAYKIWYSPTTHPCPTICTHSFTDDGTAVWKVCQRLNLPPFHLVCLYNLPLDAFLSPWPADSVRKGQLPFSGEAEQHLNNLCEHILPEVERQLPHPSTYVALAGYSLAGLFTLWSATRNGIFHRLACVSASFWYPNFISYLQLHSFVRQPDCIYLSLGDKESRTHHPLMQQVDTCTSNVYQIIQERNIPCVYEHNPGNHFTDPDFRMAKAIQWILQR